MNIYHPSLPPNPEEWLELDESMRIELVRKFHEASQDEFEDHRAKELHSVLHVIVENQIALGMEAVSEAISRLVRQGLSRHESVHAVGAILSQDLFEIMQGNTEHDIKKYRRRLGKLTAKRWRKGQW